MTPTTQPSLRPVNWPAWEVQAMQRGAKSQFRVPVRPQPVGECPPWAVYEFTGSADDKKLGFHFAGENPNASQHFLDIWPKDGFGNCPFGSVGDRLWVREQWAEWMVCGGQPKNRSGKEHVWGNVLYRATHRGWLLPECEGFSKWRSAASMPAWASRFTLEIVRVRVERLGFLTTADAIAEGIDCDGGDDEHRNRSSIENFALEWDATYGKRFSWESGPFVWAIDFRRVEQP